MYIVYIIDIVLANVAVDQGSILFQVITKTQKWYKTPHCLTHSVIR